MSGKHKVVIPGGSGFLGRLLARWFVKKGMDVVILSRRQFDAEHGRVIVWDGKTTDKWCAELEGAVALINLSGRSVDCRYSASNRKILTDSRIFSTRILGEAVNNCKNPPLVWLNSSTATIYEHTYGSPHSEDGRIAGSPEAKDEFSIELATAWENEFNAVDCPNSRKILLRTAMVFDGKGSVFKVLRRLVKFGLGGKMGHGKQYVSWIHSKDFCRAVETLVFDNKAFGIYNIASPNPIPNKTMMKIIRDSLGIPIGLPASKLMLEIGAFFLRTETELIIKSRRVVPTRLLSEGFFFEYPDFDQAVSSFS